MKLHRIELKNLNSLYESHRVDLDRDLGEAPVFMILGPTGAGKSTLLDAICLALFGETPRLDRQRGQLHTDSRHVMSQGTGECMAAVEFSKRQPDGERLRFRATWFCRRSKLRPEGRLQTAERSLARLDETGHVRSTIGPKGSRQKIDAAFDDALEGLKVEDFKRTMLLAQGEFAAFIRASQGERAAILERLTRTDIFKRLGRGAADRLRALKAEQQSIEAEAKSSAMLGVEELTGLRRALDVAQEARDTLKQALDRARQEEGWWSGRLALSKAHEAASSDARAAQAALLTHEAEFEGLIQDARCRHAESLLRDLRRLDTEIERLAHQIAELDSAREAQKSQAEHAQRALEAARALKEARTAEIEAARPELTRARTLRQSLRRAEDERRMIRHACVEAEETFRQAASELAALEEALEEAITLRERRARACEKVSHLEGLTRDLAALKTRHHHLGQYAVQLQRRRATRDEDMASLGALKTDASLMRTQVAEAHSALQPFVQARQEAMGRLKGAMSGAEDLSSARAGLRAALDGLEQRQSMMARAGESETRMAQLAEASRGVEAELESLSAGLSELTGDDEAATERLHRARQEVEGLTGHVGDLKLALSLSQERAGLKPGRPCPLCGSDSHPYAESGDLDEQDARLERRYGEISGQLSEARARLARAEEARSRLSTRIAAQRAKIDTHQRTLDESRGHRRALEAHRSASLEGAGLEPDTSPESLLAAREALKAQATRISAALGDLEAGASLLQTCEQTLSEGERAVEGLSSSLEAIQARVDDHEKSVSRHDEAISALQRDIDEASGALLEKLREHLIPVPIHEGELDIAWSVEEATRRMGQFLDKRNALALAEAQAAEALTARDECRARAESAQVRHGEKVALNQARAEASESLRVEVEAHPYASHPARFELAFEEAVQEAEAAQAAAQQEATAFWRRFERTQALFEEKCAARAASGRQREEVVARVTEQLGDLDIDDLEALTGALLSPMERQRLEALQKRLDTNQAVALVTLERSRVAMDEHDDARPEGLEILALSTEALALRRAEAETRYESAALDVRRASEALDEQSRLASGHEDLQKRLMEASAQTELWRTMHQLIGRGDGDEFRLFAQIINLQGLLELANTHLTVLAPRYRLVTATDAKDRPVLDFAVRDDHHSGQVRPLTTLSGGETFLVSLALALALSDHHAAHMPIETLLLDEGVSTLDRQALDTALGALERLHRGGTQIGIISHIDSLRDRIPARIVVEKIGGGRSSLRFEATPSTGGQGM